jgi:hypothetical protein
MNLIKRLTYGVGNLLKPTYNIREIIPGWDDEYPEPMFTDEWELSSEQDYFTSDIGEYKWSDFNSDDSIDVDQELYDRTDYDVDYLEQYSQDDRDFLKLIDGCPGCKYFCYDESFCDIICTVHPSGNMNCLEFEIKN